MQILVLEGRLDEKDYLYSVLKNTEVFSILYFFTILQERSFRISQKE